TTLVMADTDNFVADRRVAVPGAAQGDEGVVPVLRWELPAAVVNPLHSRHMGLVGKHRSRGLVAELPLGHFRWIFRHMQVDLLVATTERPAVVVAFFQQVNFFGGPVIAPPIAGMIPAIELAGF